MIFMDKIQDVKGLGGMLNGFRDLVKDEGRIAFIGSPGFCTPFALFLGYPVREKELVFIPGLQMDKARSIVATDYGMELAGATDALADVVVVLGGMAMPKIGVRPEEMKEFLRLKAVRQAGKIPDIRKHDRHHLSLGLATEDAAL